MTGGNMRPWSSLYSISKQPNWRLTSWPHTKLSQKGQVAHKGEVVLRHWDTGSDFPPQLFFFDYWAARMHFKCELRSMEVLCSSGSIYFLNKVAVTLTKWLENHIFSLLVGALKWFLAWLSLSNTDWNICNHYLIDKRQICTQNNDKSWIVSPWGSFSATGSESVQLWSEIVTSYYIKMFSRSTIPRKWTRVWWLFFWIMTTVRP